MVVFVSVGDKLRTQIIGWLHGRQKKSNRKAMNRNWSNQKANPALKKSGK